MVDLKNFLNNEVQIKAKKVTDEATTRRNLFNLARAQGSDGELQKIFDRTDMLLRNCTNPVEAKHIKIMAIAEIHNLLNVQKELVVNGVEILPAKNKDIDFVF